MQGMPAIEVDRGSHVIHAAVLGTGKPMVALAGGPGFSGRAVWGIGFGVKDSVKTYLFDQLGTGKSRMKAPGSDLTPHLTLDETLADLEALRKASGAKKWVVLGQSWGAIVALNYAAKYPGNVEHLILTSVPGLDLDGFVLQENLAKRVPKAVQEKLNQFAARPGVSEEDAISKSVLGILPYYFHEPEIGQVLAKSAPAEMFSPKVFLGLQGYILTTERYRTNLARLKSTRFSVTMIQGHQDPCGAAMPYLLRERFFPRANVWMVGSCGHFPWIEQPLKFFDIIHTALKFRCPPIWRTKQNPTNRR